MRTYAMNRGRRRCGWAYDTFVIRCGLPIIVAVICIVLTGCSTLRDAREIKEAPMPPKYVEKKVPGSAPAEGSLWVHRASLFEDSKARRVNDLVTILISEKSTASKKATTKADRDSSAEYGINDLLGLKFGAGLQSLNNIYIPNTISGNGKSEFDGKGDTAREGKLGATITAKVIDVLPNSNLVIESRKEVVVNNEKEILVLRGIVRPEDISPKNTVRSDYIADAQIYLVGDGVLDDKQAQGWLVRIADKVWPF
jgi:flagellar L-ring protein precursor FlgH